MTIAMGAAIMASVTRRAADRYLGDLMSIVGGARPRSPGGTHSSSANALAGFKSAALGLEADRDCDGSCFLEMDAGAECFNLEDLDFDNLLKDRQWGFNCWEKVVDSIAAGSSSNVFHEEMLNVVEDV